MKHSSVLQYLYCEIYHLTIVAKAKQETIRPNERPNIDP